MYVRKGAYARTSKTQLPRTQKFVDSSHFFEHHSLKKDAMYKNPQKKRHYSCYGICLSNSPFSIRNYKGTTLVAWGPF